ncbi:YjcZ family sporulation protein [Lysinibacillus sp. CTST325]
MILFLDGSLYKGNNGSTFVLIVFLFILLIVVGATFMY